jgi:hypothetical protein
MAASLEFYNFSALTCSEKNILRQKKSPRLAGFLNMKRVHLAILTPSDPGTTFAATELDFRVRDVTGYFLSAIDTPKLYKGSSFVFRYKACNTIFNNQKTRSAI